MSSIKKAITAIAITTALFGATIANAQIKTDSTKKDTTAFKKRLLFGIGVEASKGLTGFTDAWTYGFTPGLQYNLSKSFALTFTSGLYLTNTNTIVTSVFSNGGMSQRFYSSELLIPLKAGFKAFVSPKFYLGAEGGVVFQPDDGGAWVKPTVAPGLGFATKKWDFNARYERFSNQQFSISMAGLRIAYTIDLLKREEY